MDDTRNQDRETHDQMLARCQESPAVKAALGNLFDACDDFIFAMVSALAELKEEDERNKG